jgi:acetamidase/formamidase
VAHHELPCEAWALHRYFSGELDPVLTVEQGDTVELSTPNHAWELEPDKHLTARNPQLDTGHALAGPIEVRGAKGDWGVTYGGKGHAVIWELAEGVGRALGRELGLAPFLRVMGMPPPEPGVHSTVPPRPSGGNIDCKELVAGATLYLPIPVDGALFSAGDGHAAQRDGEVSGTAIETPVRARLTLDVSDEPALQWPMARIDGAWLTFGFHRSLGMAARSRAWSS